MPVSIRDIVNQAEKVRRLNEKRQELVAQREQFQANIASINTQLSTINTQLSNEVNLLRSICNDLFKD